MALISYYADAFTLSSEYEAMPELAPFSALPRAYRAADAHARHAPDAAAAAQSIYIYYRAPHQLSSVRIYDYRYRRG